MYTWLKWVNWVKIVKFIKWIFDDSPTAWNGTSIPPKQPPSNVETKLVSGNVSVHTTSGQNNGGATSYYDLPPESDRPCIDDLIEHKDMPRWRSEPFKTLYALEGRTGRATDGSSSEERELHKCFYYLNRRMKMLGLKIYEQNK